MGLFDFYRKGSNGSANGHANNAEANQQSTVDIPENIFIEKATPNVQGEEKSVTSASSEDNIEMLYEFLGRNLEGKGYDDALINPDAKHLEENISYLKNDLQRTIGKVKRFYHDFLKEIDFHIASRSRSGMIDTVDELTMKKEIAESHVLKVRQIEADANNDTGESQGLIMSYTKGFKNGLAAISHHSILKRKL